MQPTRPLRYLSLFSGIGGFEVGIQKVFPDAKCVGFSEVNDDALTIYRKNFPDHPYLGPVQEVKGNYGVDLVVGGSPCQDLSSVNFARTGLEGKKSSLFFEFVRVLNENKPCHFIFENVGSMRKDDMKRISDTLGVQPVKLNSKDFSGQSRSRYFWASFPISQPSVPSTATLADCLLSVEELEKSPVRTQLKKNSRLYETYKDRERKGLTTAGYYSVSESDSAKSKTLTTTPKTWILDKRYGGIPRMRKMHPIEAERLQTFPDGWTEGLCATRRMKLLGNSITCNVVSHIVSYLRLN